MCLLIIWDKQTTYKWENGSFGKNFIINKMQFCFPTIQTVVKLCWKGWEKEVLGIDSISVTWKADRCVCWTALSALPGPVSTLFHPACALGDRPCQTASMGLPCLWLPVSLSQWETVAGDQQAGVPGMCFPLKGHSSWRWPFSRATSLGSFG